MIISKPKPNALIAMGTFVVLMLTLGLYALNSILNGNSAWYQIVAAGITLPLGVLLAIRQLLSYKIVQVGDNKVIARYPFKNSRKEFSIKDMIHWKEEVIKTKNAPFKQIELKFQNDTLKLTIQENTGYEDILKYLRKKATKKEVK